MSSRAVIVALLPTVLLGSICAYLYGEVKRERERARVESELRSELQGRVAQLDGTRAQLEREIARLRTHPDDTLRIATPRAAVNANTAVSVSVGGGSSLAVASVNDAPFARPSEAQVEWMRSPIARDLMKAHQRDWIRRSGDELFELLDLSPEQRDALIDLMADAQTPAVDYSAPGSTDPAALQNMHNRLREQQRETDLAIKELLGEEKYRAYQDYQGSAMERMQVAELQRLFDGTPTPLRAEQSAQLLAALGEERAPVPLPIDRAPSAEDLERYQQWADEQALRVRERIATLLTPEQLERFMAYHQMQDAMRLEAGGPHGLVQGGVVFSASGVQSTP
ncbi:MAG TPA: hypothetical protein VJ764_00320 [Steroidobacteraceae bacterium]|nr:hypothetical protein [Steroidobacteraceae bacterium]